MGDSTGNVYAVKDALTDPYAKDDQQQQQQQQKGTEPSLVRLDDADHMSHITCVAFDPMDGNRLVTASRDCKVCLYVRSDSSATSEASKNDDPTAGYRFQSYACRTESGMSVNDVEFSSMGSKFCVASNEDCIRIVDIDTSGKVVKETKVDAHEGGCLQAVFDPINNRYLATVGVDKSVKIWDLSPGGDDKIKCVKTLFNVTSKEVVRLWLRVTVEDDLLPMKLLQWTPDGKFIAVLKCDDKSTYTISFLAVGTWKESKLPEHVAYAELLRSADNPYMIRFSPNGVYLAVVDAKRVTLFDHEYHTRSESERGDSQKITSIDMGKNLVSSLQWCTFADAIVICNTHGHCTRLEDFNITSVNSYSVSHSKALVKASMEDFLDDMGQFEDKNHDSREQATESMTEMQEAQPSASDFLADEANVEAMDNEDDENEEDDKDEEMHEDAMSSGDADHVHDDKDDSMSISEIKSLYADRKTISQISTSSMDAGPVMPHSMFRVHEPFQPGATPFDSENRRIMAWNNTGIIVCTKLGKGTSKQQSIEIEFCDSTRQTIRINDRDDLSMAALNDYGAIFAAKCNALAQPNITPSFIQFQPFKTRSQTNLRDAAWQYPLPTGEEVECVGMVAEYVLVATSTAIQRNGVSMHKYRLRVLNVTGIQHFSYSLPTPVVTVAGFDSAKDPNHCRLLVVMQDGFTMTSPTTAHPNLIYTVLEISLRGQYSSRVMSSGEKVLITQGSKLRWIGFTQLGFLATVDTGNIVRLLSLDWQGWTEVLDLTQCYRSPHGNDDISYYVSSITDKHVMFYPCKNANAIPPIVPRPVVDVKEFNMDMLPSTPLFEIEKKYALHSMVLNQKLRTQIELGQPTDTKRIIREEKDLDKVTLSMIFEAIENELPEQALALSRQFRTQRAIELSKQPAMEKKHFVLAKRIGETEEMLFGNKETKSLIPNTTTPAESKTVVIKERVVERIVEKASAPPPMDVPLPTTTVRHQRALSAPLPVADSKQDSVPMEDDRITTSTISELESSTAGAENADADVDSDGEMEVDFNSMLKSPSNTANSTTQSSQLSQFSDTQGTLSLFSPSRRKPKKSAASKKQNKQQQGNQKQPKRVSPFVSFNPSDKVTTSLDPYSLSTITSGGSTSKHMPNQGDRVSTEISETKKRKREADDNEEGLQAKKKTVQREAREKSKHWRESRTKQKQELLSSVFGKKKTDGTLSEVLNQALHHKIGMSSNGKTAAADDDDDSSDEEFAGISVS